MLASMPFLDRTDLERMGFRHLGAEVLVSDKASFYGAANISIGDRTRIDDFCILSAGSGGICIGRNVHVSCYASIIGAGSVTVEDFVALSVRSTVFSSNDDYSGEHMTNSTVPGEFKRVAHAPVTIRRHAMVAAGAIVLPGVELGEGSVLGALSLANRDLEPWGIYAGVPAKKVKERSRRLLELESAYLNQLSNIT